MPDKNPSHFHTSGRWKTGSKTFQLSRVFLERIWKISSISASANRFISEAGRTHLQHQGNISNISPGLGFTILERDNFKCVFCGRNPVTDSGTKVHIDPVFRFFGGGKSNLEIFSLFIRDTILEKMDILSVKKRLVFLASYRSRPHPCPAWGAGEAPSASQWSGCGEERTLIGSSE